MHLNPYGGASGQIKELEWPSVNEIRRHTILVFSKKVDAIRATPSPAPREAYTGIPTAIDLLG
jgi:hypothetical protein